ncbi:MAG TPA: beta-ketoacyl-ACP reductase [Lentisphaeria bacterium]|jgi:3-oxoacyl-[acyl-carrier protein] reductase|nr:beta-ketoacyl-ACP reductase [Lentisphaeria bacterium]
MDLTDQVAIVTGGSRGIGKGIARSLAAQGARVIIVSVRPEPAQAAIDELAVDGLTIESHLANVAESAEIDAMVKQISKSHGRIDILVNNAGVTRDNLLVRLKQDDWDTVMNINLRGAFNCIKAVSRPMMKARSGRIVNISSIVGLTGNAGQANYSASKAGLIGLGKAAAKELAARNITVNTVAPGYIATEMTDELTDEQREAFLTHIPLARPGSPEDIAAAVSFLVSPAASYITGQTLTVDGGMVMQ